MELTLHGTTVVITGSSRGIGSELVGTLAREGASVVINYRSSEGKARELLAEVSSFNGSCIMVQADVRNKRDVAELYKTSLERYGKLDVLINTAGTIDDNPIQLMSSEQWRNVIESNLDSVFLCCKYFSRNMIKTRSGKIINIASLTGQTGAEGQANYSASKAGVIGFTKALAKELARRDVTVNAVCSGFIATDMTREEAGKKMTVARTGGSGTADCLHSVDYMPVLSSFIAFMISDHLHSLTGESTTWLHSFKRVAVLSTLPLSRYAGRPGDPNKRVTRNTCRQALSDNANPSD